MKRNSSIISHLFDHYLSGSPVEIFDDKRIYCINSHAKLKFFLDRCEPIAYGYSLDGKRAQLYVLGQWSQEFDKKFCKKEDRA